MNLLVVGHSYITPFAQSKYVAMKRLAPDLRLRIVTPLEMGHIFMRYRHRRHPDLAPEETQVIPTLVGQSPMTYLLNPGFMMRLLLNFAPDHIHIEEDPHSIIGVETVTLAQWVCPQATISFFIWDNLNHIPRFPLNVVKRLLSHYSLRFADLVVCGNREAEYLLRTVKSYSRRTIVLPQVGLDAEDYSTPSRLEVCSQLSVEPDEPRIGFIGRLVPEKGLRILLEALQHLQHLPWHMLLIGNGPLVDEVRDRWLPLFGPRLVYLEAVPHDEVAHYLKCLDIFVLPSYGTKLWKEQFGLTLAQAMMAGTVCIGSDSGAIPEVIGTAGFVVPACSVSKLCEVLETVLTSSEIRRVYKEKARTRAQQLFTNESVARQYLDAFRTLARQQGPMIADRSVVR